MVMLTLDERKRRSRNILFAALGLLVLIWTIKLSFPQHTIVSAYTTFVPPSHTTPENSEEASKAQLAVQSEPAKAIEKPKIIPGSIALASEQDFSALSTLNSSKAAVIIETRFRTNMIPLVLHFSTVLGPTWPVFIYTNAEGVGLFSASAALARQLHLGVVQIRILPQSVLLTNSDSVSGFMTSKWLWESLAPAEHVLIFQSDSMLCSNAARSVEDFFMYDLVGAPIAPHLGKGYNGGLSLRKRSSTMRVLEEWDWLATKDDGDQFFRYEDQWYYHRFVELQEQEEAAGILPEAEGAINLPSMEIARTFAVETIDYPHPLGVHQVNRWFQSHMKSLDDWCPEYKLCSAEFIGD